MTYEIEIGRGKRGRRAYSLDDIAIVPNRRTRDPKDVSVAWQIDAYKFDMPVIAAPMDSAMSPETVIALGRLGGLKGGPARAAKLSAKRRREIASKAARARWGKPGSKTKT